MTKVIQCPACASELSEKTARYKPTKDNRFKMRCGLCRYAWIAQVQDFHVRPAVAPLQSVVMT